MHYILDSGLWFLIAGILLVIAYVLLVRCVQHRSIACLILGVVVLWIACILGLYGVLEFLSGYDNSILMNGVQHRLDFIDEKTGSIHRYSVDGKALNQTIINPKGAVESLKLIPLGDHPMSISKHKYLDVIVSESYGGYFEYIDFGGNIVEAKVIQSPSEPVKEIPSQISINTGVGA